jgi:NAD-dependent SIR2 family protein deacetylase
MRYVLAGSKSGGHVTTSEAHGRHIPVTRATFLADQVVGAPNGECPYVLLLGAGASASSGLPTASALIDRWRRQIFVNTRIGDTESTVGGEYDHWLESVYQGWLESLSGESEYSSLFEYIYKTREQRQMFIEKLIAPTRPGLGYFYLAGLIDAGWLNTVLTTNFDDLVQDALIQYFNRKAVVCAFDSTVSSFNASTLRPKIVKLHGDFLFSDIKNTETETLDLGSNMEDKLVELCENKGLIVVGYSGGDESVMAPIRENLRKNKKFLTKGIHWCVLDDHVSNGYTDGAAVGTGLSLLQRRYPDRVFVYQTQGFDEFMLGVFETADVQLPDGMLKPHARNLARDFYDACTEYEIDKRLTGPMRRHLQIAVKSLSEEGFRSESEMIKADAEFKEASTLQNRQQWDQALSLLEESLEVSRRVSSGEPARRRLFWLAVGRELGCLTGIAVCLSHGRSNLSDEAIAALDLARSGAVSSMRLPPSRSDDAEDGYLAALYNGICACGLLWPSASDTASLRADASALLTEMLSWPKGERQRMKLRSDLDIAPLLGAGAIQI